MQSRVKLTVSIRRKTSGWVRRSMREAYDGPRFIAITRMSDNLRTPKDLRSCLQDKWRKIAISLIDEFIRLTLKVIPNRPDPLRQHGDVNSALNRLRIGSTL